MNIVIASGKGGTGKTTVALNLAYYLAQFKGKKVSLLDCDVEAPNDNLFLNSHFTESCNVSALRPLWDNKSCSLCGKCTLICHYKAIVKIKNKISVFSEMCHSCGACVYLCPNKALKENQVIIGKLELAFDNGPFSFGQGLLNVGETMAPKVISELKKRMSKDLDSINIIDASPGITCPVVKAMEQMDYCLLVTEPTPFGLHDLKLAAALSAKLNIPTGIVINRFYEQNDLIENFALSCNIPILAKIPFERKYAISYSKGDILVKKHPELRDIFEKIFLSISEKKASSYIAASDIALNLEKDTETRSVFPTENNLSTPIREILVLSGKGGTGKTTISAALNILMNNKIMVDTDVDASNFHLLCKPVLIESGDFIAGKKYRINQDQCTSCGLCEKICNFDAIKSSLNKNNQKILSISETSCEGCGFCFHICNNKAISSFDSLSGKWFLSETSEGYLSHAALEVGQENSGKLVSLVRNKARVLVKRIGSNNILSDGPPGTGCPVISSLSGVDIALLVTEPSLSGLHDMMRVLELTEHFAVKTFIIINKFDINKEVTEKILHFAKEKDIKVIGKIPFDKRVNDSLMENKTIVSLGKGPAFKAILDFWKCLQEELK